jgi:hypothetical protein
MHFLLGAYLSSLPHSGLIVHRNAAVFPGTWENIFAWRLANRLFVSYMAAIIPVKFNFPSRCDRSARAA